MLPRCIRAVTRRVPVVVFLVVTALVVSLQYHDRHHLLFYPAADDTAVRPVKLRQLSTNFTETSSEQPSVVSTSVPRTKNLSEAEVATKTSIPRIIHQIWLRSDTTRPLDLMNSCMKMAKANSWKYRLWSSEDLTGVYLKYNESVRTSDRPHLVTQLFKMDILIREGGLYIGPYVKCRPSVTINESLPESSFSVIDIKGSTRWSLDAVQATKNHPVLLKLQAVLARRQSPSWADTLPESERDTSLTSIISPHFVRSVGWLQWEAMRSLSWEKLSSVAVNQTVIVAEVNCGFMPMVANWLYYVQQLNITNYLLVARDEGAARMLSHLAPGHFVRSNAMLNDAQSRQSHRFMSSGFMSLMKGRPALLLGILEHGFNVLLTDTDMVWLRNPFHYFNHSADVVAAVDRENSPMICGCLLYLKAAPRSLKFVIMMQHYMKNSRRNDQTAINEVTQLPEFKNAIHRLDRYLFPTGKAFFANPKKWAKNPPAVVHNNFIVGMDKKMERFVNHSQWHIERSFVKLTEEVCRQEAAV